MGLLFGRHHKSRADITLEDLQNAADARQQGDVQPSPLRIDDPVGYASSADPSVPPAVVLSPSPSNAPGDTAAGFSLFVERVIPIKHFGVVIWGRVTDGTITVGQQAKVASRPTAPIGAVAAIEVGKKRRRSAQAGDATVGLVFKGVSDKDIQEGDQIVG